MKKTYILFAVALLVSLSTFAEDYKVSEQSGATNYDRFAAAMNLAQANDRVILDTDVIFNTNNRSYKLTTSGIKIIGADRNNGKYKLIRQVKTNSNNPTNNGLLEILANDILVQNIEIIINIDQGNRGIVVGTTKPRTKVFSNITIDNCIIKQLDDLTPTTPGINRARGINFEGSFSKIKITKTSIMTWISIEAKDCPTLDDFLVSECTILGSITIDNALLGEDDPDLTLNQDLVLQKNIVIEKSRFLLTPSSHNIALANTSDVIIRDNPQMDGGEQSYSQCVHIEDHTQNVTIVGNTMNSTNDAGITIYTTDRIGHGQGRRHTEEEKREKGSGNITIENNVINAKNHAVESAYLNGFVKFIGNNKLYSEIGPAIRIRSNPGNVPSLQINDNTMLKDRTYLAVKDKNKVVQEIEYLSSDIPVTGI